MTPSSKKSKRIKYIAIYELIYGWYHTLLKAPEIKDIISKNPRNILKRSRVQISECASIKFVEKYEGYRLLQRRNAVKIRKYLIKSFAECI